MITKLQSAAVKETRPGLDEVINGKRFPITAMAENIRSLYNVGSLFRTADGAGIEKLYLCGYTGYPPRKEIEKTALGSTKTVPWERYEDPAIPVRRLKENGYRIVCLEHTDRSVPYTDLDWRFPICLVVGNEVDGITGELVALCDNAVDIPMHGIKQSLNVSVAFGIVIYHLVECLRGAGGK